MSIKRKLKSAKEKSFQILEKSAKSIPGVTHALDKQYDKMMEEISDSVKPYKDVEDYTTLPENPPTPSEVLDLMQRLNKKEEPKWTEGFVSGGVYHGGKEHIEFLNQVYALNSQSNPLHSDVWPSTVKYEAEIVAMTADMMNGNRDEVCGTLSSGGTESILLAMKTYRDQALKEKGIKKPELIVPDTAHPAFDKAAQYFNITIHRIPVGPNFKADVKAMKKAINKNTIAMVGSAPNFPHGLIDPIPELSEIAKENGIGFHTDCCLGGFIMPWLKELGYEVPSFDFSLPGVTSMSADTHKYGYASKGTSVVLYRNQDLRHYQYFVSTEWSGGLYFSPSFAGSRPGALSAACWAAMITTGRNGYLNSAKAIMDTATKIKSGIQDIPELEIIGDPLWVIAFRSKQLNIYKIMDFMATRKWSLNGLHKPEAVHIAITLTHTRDGVADRFINDLRDAVEHVKSHPKDKGKMAPIYGLAAKIPFRGSVADILRRYIDILYKV